MAKNFSDTLKANLIRTSAEESPLCLLTIENDMLGTPIRVVRDFTDVVSNGETYAACNFDYSLPNESENEVPRCQLSIDNVGRTLTSMFEQLQGAPETTCYFQLIKRSEPDFVEFDIKMDLVNVTITRFRVQGDLQFDRTLNRPAISQIYNKRNAPGLY